MAFPLMAMAAPALISAGGSLLSGLFGAKKKKKAQQELINYQRSLRLDPVTGRFGAISVGEEGVDAGVFGGLQEQLAGAAGDLLSGVDFEGLPPGVSDALGMLRSRAGTPVNADLMAQLFSGASGLAGDLSRGFEDTRSSALQNFRSAAQPEQQRAVDSTLSRLFSQGRLGTSGGANIVGRLAEAQNQQDLGFQMAAGQEARATSQDVLSRFQSLFSGATDLEETGYNRGLDLLEAEGAAAALPSNLAQAKLSAGQQLLGSSMSIQDLINSAFNNALNKSTAATNVRVAGAGLNTSTMTSPNYSASPMADAFQSLFAGMQQPGGGGIQNLFARIGRGRTPGIGGDVDRFQTL